MNSRVFNVQTKIETDNLGFLIDFFFFFLLSFTFSLIFNFLIKLK